jgi:hypothetical protein
MDIISSNAVSGTVSAVKKHTEHDIAHRTTAEDRVRLFLLSFLLTANRAKSELFLELIPGHIAQRMEKRCNSSLHIQHGHDNVSVHFYCQTPGNSPDARRSLPESWLSGIDISACNSR